MESIHFMSNYFVAPENRCKPDIRLKDGSGIKLPWSMQRSYSDMSRYLNWLSSLIKYSIEVDIEVTKLANLMMNGVAKKLGWADEDDFLIIFLDSLERNDNGLGIEENRLSHNAKVGS